MEDTTLRNAAAALRQLKDHLITEGFGPSSELLAAALPEILRIEHEAARESPGHPEDHAGHEPQAAEPEKLYCLLCGRAITLEPGTTWPWRLARNTDPALKPAVCRRSLHENHRHIPE